MLQHWPGTNKLPRCTVCLPIPSYARLQSMAGRKRGWAIRLFGGKRTAHGSPAHADPWQHANLPEGGRARRKLRARPSADQTFTAEAEVTAPRFFPFVPQTSVRQAFLEYRYRSRAAAQGGCSLLIRPISQRQLSATTELLTQCFGDAMGSFAVYRTFLKRHIQKYLEQHVELPPKAVVLVALLQPSAPPGTAEGTAASTAARLPGAQGPPWAGPAQEGSREAGRAGEEGRLNGAAAHQEMRTNLEELMQRLIGAGAAARSAEGVPALQDGSQEAQGRPQQGQAGGEEGRAERFGACSGRDAEEADNGGALVGTVEVSIAASTRTRFLTLNAPEECAYICNMAVAPGHRRRGYGLLLLEAAEEVARLGGQRDLYLHLRLKDTPAQALYERAGYAPVRKDGPLVLLLGQDRRFLMHKRLTPGLTPGSA